MDKESLRKRLEEHALANGFKLNSNEKLLSVLLEGLLRTDGFCPCRVPSNDPEVIKRFTCPCIAHKAEIEAIGHCHCFLFVQ